MCKSMGFQCMVDGKGDGFFIGSFVSEFSYGV